METSPHTTQDFASPSLKRWHWMHMAVKILLGAFLGQVALIVVCLSTGLPEMLDIVFCFYSPATYCLRPLFPAADRSSLVGVMLIVLLSGATAYSLVAAAVTAVVTLTGWSSRIARLRRRSGVHLGRSQYRLSMLLFIVFLASVVFAVIGVFARRSAREETAVRILRSRGARLTYRWGAIEHIDLHGKQFSDSDLLGLKVLYDLRSLDLGRTQVTSSGLQAVAHLPKLGMLCLDDTKVGDEGLAHLSRTPHLDSLMLSNTSVTSKGLSYVRGQRAITILRLDGTSVDDGGMQVIRGFTELYWLFLDNTKVTDSGVTQLKNLKKLEYLALRNCKLTDASMSSLAVLPSLNTLELRGTSITDQGLLHLARSSSLGSIEVSSTRVTREGIKAFQKVRPNTRVFKE